MGLYTEEAVENPGIRLNDLPDEFVRGGETCFLSRSFPIPLKGNLDAEKNSILNSFLLQPQ
ncbi:hypothetical protein ACFL5V_12745 [Fibrobacterota bacterium]